MSPSTSYTTTTRATTAIYMYGVPATDGTTDTNLVWINDTDDTTNVPGQWRHTVYQLEPTKKRTRYFIRGNELHREEV
jgi:hypothetical protein